MKRATAILSVVIPVMGLIVVAYLLLGSRFIQRTTGLNGVLISGPSGLAGYSDLAIYFWCIFIFAVSCLAAVALKRGDRTLLLVAGLILLVSAFLTTFLIGMMILPVAATIIGSWLFLHPVPDRDAATESDPPV